MEFGRKGEDAGKSNLRDFKKHPNEGCFEIGKQMLHNPAPRVGLEPTTHWLTASCSTIELPRSRTV